MTGSGATTGVASLSIFFADAAPSSFFGFLGFGLDRNDRRRRFDPDVDQLGQRIGHRQPHRARQVEQRQRQPDMEQHHQADGGGAFTR